MMLRQDITGAKGPARSCVAFAPVGDAAPNRAAEFFANRHRDDRAGSRIFFSADTAALRHCHDDAGNAATG